MTRPVLWTFRRCPFAIRARLAIASSKIEVELREILLRDKPKSFLRASQKATVPVLEQGGQVIEESLEIMIWALNRNDPEGWLDMPDLGNELIAEIDGPFKTALDRYKYATRYGDVDTETERQRAGETLEKLEALIGDSGAVFGASPTLADIAILPFVRQFAHVDLNWFNSGNWPNVSAWLEAFKTSQRFQSVMHKYPAWESGQKPVLFPLFGSN